jgi:hypothetical protein
VPVVADLLGMAAHYFRHGDDPAPVMRALHFATIPGPICHSGGLTPSHACGTECAGPQRIRRLSGTEGAGCAQVVAPTRSRRPRLTVQDSHAPDPVDTSADDRAAHSPTGMFRPRLRRIPTLFAGSEGWRGSVLSVNLLLTARRSSGTNFLEFSPSPASPSYRTIRRNVDRSRLAATIWVSCGTGRGICEIGH